MNEIFRIVLILIITFLISAGLSAQSYEVKGAGTEDVNGIYEPAGKKNGKTQYTNGKYILYYKGCHSKWMIVSGEDNMYRNSKDTSTPPETGWQKGCGKGSLEPVPVVVPVTEEPENEN